MTALHVEHRPFPGYEPAPAPDPAKTAASALARARRALTEPPAEHPRGCRCSAWCRDDWYFAERGAPALGPCTGCGEPCRSSDPEGRLLHPTCEVPA